MSSAQRLPDIIDRNPSGSAKVSALVLDSFLGSGTTAAVAHKMGRKRNELRQNLFSAQDEVDKRKESLLGKVKLRLKQQLVRQPIMTVRWKIF